MKVLKDVCSSSFNCRPDKKKGCFSVVAVGGAGEPKKFFIALEYLSYPPFLELLEAAEKEFGFQQQGVLAVPCEASDLQRILSIDWTEIVGMSKLYHATQIESGLV